MRPARSHAPLRPGAGRVDPGVTFWVVLALLSVLVLSVTGAEGGGRHVVPAQPLSVADTLPTPGLGGGATTNAPARAEGSGEEPAGVPPSEAPVLATENLLPAAPVAAEEVGERETERIYMTKVETARLLRRERNPKLAAQTLLQVLQSNAPAEPKRAALLELGLCAQDEGKLSRAQHLFTQYVQQYPTDPQVPEVFLRQGLIYRQMGLNNLAVAKFYNVMNSALVMRMDQFDFYRRLVLQAMTEIADTYFLEGRYGEAADFFQRVLKQDAADLNRLQIRFKLVRALAAVRRDAEAVAVAEEFLKEHGEATEVAEVRFLLASSLKQLGRNREAMRRVLELLAAQQSEATKNPDAWVYWQQRAGNDIANQLYQEGDYLTALEIYLSLAGMSSDPAWQLPVWYQIGLVYERIQQPMKAAEHYERIRARQGELSTNAPLSLKAVVDMARWREEFLGWQTRTEAKVRQLQSHVVTNTPSLTASP